MCSVGLIYVLYFCMRCKCFYRNNICIYLNILIKIYVDIILVMELIWIIGEIFV